MPNTITENDNRPSATVESLMDVDNSTCEVDSFKGRTTFAINKKTPYPFSFGILKARLLVKHALHLFTFVATEGKTIKPPQELVDAWSQFMKVYNNTKF